MRNASHTAPLMNRTACREERVQVTRDDMRTPLQLPLFLEVSVEMVSSCPFSNSLDHLLHFSQLFSRSLLAFWLPCGMKSTVLLTWQRARQCPNSEVQTGSAVADNPVYQIPPTTASLHIAIVCMKC